MRKIEGVRVPAHVAIIMDGNGRWAEQRGAERSEGHRHGIQPVRHAVGAAIEAGVRYLTIYAFSTENWRRPAAEVTALMQLLIQSIDQHLQELIEQGVRLLTIGDLSKLPPLVQEAIAEAKRLTAHGDKLTLTVALNYGARDEIANAARCVAQRAVAGEVSCDQIDAELLAQHLETAMLPDPDLLIRTSGESRLSNFLLWQLAYAEFVFMPVLWPDFTKEHFQSALDEYAARNRRFGGVSTGDGLEKTDLVDG